MPRGVLRSLFCGGGAAAACPPVAPQSPVDDDPPPPTCRSRADARAVPVRYRLASRPLFVHCCHCRWCQRESGAAFALNAMIEIGARRAAGAARPSSSTRRRRAARASGSRAARTAASRSGATTPAPATRSASSASARSTSPTGCRPTSTSSRLEAAVGGLPPGAPRSRSTTTASSTGRRESLARRDADARARASRKGDAVELGGEAELDAAEGRELGAVVARAGQQRRAGAGAGGDDGRRRRARAVASGRRVGEQHDRAERIAVEDRLAAAARDLVASRRRGCASGRSRPVPRSSACQSSDRRAGDEGAVVERVGELGERAEAARQARIDDLDGDAQRRDRRRDLFARVGLAPAAAAGRARARRRTRTRAWAR